MSEEEHRISLEDNSDRTMSESENKENVENQETEEGQENVQPQKEGMLEEVFSPMAVLVFVLT